ncbi:MAG TPA: hypothetical protein EYQ25_02365 [Planctomycetes bacterium]|nr:hypothetical protein [Planctomycetota bacterium]HIL38764.1 hypothetical protein [Planctomycetota bacterium]
MIPCPKRNLFIRTSALTLLAMASCASTTQPPTLNIKNFCHLAPGVVGGGQVDVAEFSAMAEGGYTLVVNLRRASEPFPANEGDLVKQAGMAYVHIPMGGDTLVANHAAQLNAALEEFGSGHVLVHCGSGNRVGALWGLHTAIQEGATPEEGVQMAKDSGMRSDSLANCVTAALTREAAPFGFRAWGSMREVLRNGKTEGRVKLSVLNDPAMIGVGAMAELSGELTIDWGVPHVVAASGDQVTFLTPGDGAQATLLALAKVPAWEEYSLPAISSLEELESIIAATAKEQGIDTGAVPAIPFRVTGRFEGLCLHVLNGSCPIANPEGPEPWRLTDANAEGALIGFYAENAAGQLTHHGQRSHVHAIVTTSAGGKAGGHVDHTRVREGASLFLPASTH